MKRLFLLAVVAAGAAFGQATQPVFVQPDCSFFFNLTSATARFPLLGYNNRNSGCVTWTVTYFSIGFTPVSLEIDSAPDSGSGTAGTWVPFVGTLVAGVNPMVSTTQTFTTIGGYNPWVSVKNGSTGSGTIVGFAYGFRVPPQTFISGGSSASNVTIVAPFGQTTMANSVPVTIASNQTAVPVSFSGTSDVNLKQVNGHTTLEGGVNGAQAVGGMVAAGSADAGAPVKIGGSNGTNDYNLKVDSQGNNYAFLGCTNTAEVALSGTGYTEIVIGTASQVIQICKIFVTSATGGAPNVNTFSVASATITSCAGSTELYVAAGITGMDSDWGGALRSGAGKSICVSETVANADKVTISYAKAIF